MRFDVGRVIVVWYEWIVVWGLIFWIDFVENFVKFVFVFNEIFFCEFVIVGENFRRVRRRYRGDVI